MLIQILIEHFVASDLCLHCLPVYHTYTMHYKFSNFLCFESFCAHLSAISNNFKCNDENRILGKLQTPSFK